MTTYLGKSCSFGLPRVPFVNCRQIMYLVISLLVLRAVPDHCLSFYFSSHLETQNDINSGLVKTCVKP